MKKNKIKINAPRKRLYYFISLPEDFWWVRNKKVPVTLDDTKYKNLVKSSVKICRTKKQAFRYLRNCPARTTVVRMLSCRAGLFTLLEWEKTK